MAKAPSQKNLQKYLRRIEYAEQKRDAGWRDRWLSWYKRYRNYVDQLKDKTRSNISVPYSFTMVETVLPRLVETLFAGRPYVSLKGIPPAAGGVDRETLQNMLAEKDRPWEDAAKKMETLVDYQHNVPMDIQDLFASGLKTMCIYGTTVSYTGWCYRERDVIRKELTPITETDPQTGEEVPMLDSDGVTPLQDYQPIKSKIKDYDDPEVRFLDLGLFYADPNGEDIDDARYCGHVCYKSLSEIKEMDKQGLIKVDFRKLAKEARSNTNEARNYRMTSVGLPTADDQDSAELDDDMHEVIYYWEDDKRVIIINRTQLVAEGENPYWHKKKPYDKDVYCEIPGEFYGIGIMQITEDLQDELNVERNQRIDYRSQSMRRMFKRRIGSNVDKSQLVWKQGGIIDVSSPEDVTLFEAPDGALGGSFNQEETIKQDIRDAVGAHDIVMGTSSGGGNTATETMAKDNNASIRFKMIISSVEKRLLLGVTRKMIQLNQQFVDDIRMLPLFDKDESEWPIITPEEIQGEFHLIPAGSSVEPMANKEAFKQRMVELYNIAAKDPFMQQFPNKRRNLLKKVFESFDMTDTDDLLPTDQELSGVIQQQAVQEFIAKLPPEVQPILMQFMQAGQQQPGEPPPGDPTQQAIPQDGGVNTAAMQEQGMQMAGVNG